MNNLDSVYLFLFIFSLLNVFRVIISFISALFQNPPQRFVLSDKALIFLGLSISYCLTYLIKL
jgi:hypothetical protein